MPLDIVTFEIGPMPNNTYLVGDPAARQAIVIDPSFGSEVVLAEVARRGWTLTAIWLTHAHFDHIAGVKAIAENAEPVLPVGLHPADLPLWRESGGARMFGMAIEPGPSPSLVFTHGQVLQLGNQAVEVRHTPGHTPGHVTFYAPGSSAAFVGDLIFFHGVGRTDLPGSDSSALIHSIREQIFTLPPATRLLSGHGPETSVAEEIAENPFVA